MRLPTKTRCLCLVHGSMMLSLMESYYMAAWLFDGDLQHGSMTWWWLVDGAFHTQFLTTRDGQCTILQQRPKHFGLKAVPSFWNMKLENFSRDSSLILWQLCVLPSLFLLQNLGQTQAQPQSLHVPSRWITAECLLGSSLNDFFCIFLDQRQQRRSHASTAVTVTFLFQSKELPASPFTALRRRSIHVTITVMRHTSCADHVLYVLFGTLMPKTSLLQASSQVCLSVLSTDFLAPIRAQLVLYFIWKQHELAPLLRFCAVNNGPGQHMKIMQIGLKLWWTHACLPSRHKQCTASTYWRSAYVNWKNKLCTQKIYICELYCQYVPKKTHHTSASANIYEATHRNVISYTYTHTHVRTHARTRTHDGTLIQDST